MVDDEDDDITVGKAITSDDKEEGMGVSNMMKVRVSSSFRLSSRLFNPCNFK